MIEQNEERYLEYVDQSKAIWDYEEKISNAKDAIKIKKHEIKELEKKIKFHEHSIEQSNFNIYMDLIHFLKEKLGVLDIPMLWNTKTYITSTFGIPKLNEDQLKKLEGYNIQISPDGFGGYIITGMDIVRIMRKDYKDKYLGEGVCLEEERCYR